MMENASVTANPESKPAEPAWSFLAEFSLGEFMSDHARGDDLTARWLFQAVRGLGIPPECVEAMELTLTELAQEGRGRCGPGRAALPGCIRVFCQSQVVAEANSQKTSRPGEAESGVEPAPARPYPGSKMAGGWGYFLIERGENLPAGNPMGLGPSIDLYLYREGG